MRHRVAIVGSDLHLSWTAPTARSPEPDWLAAQARRVRELAELANTSDVPLVLAGDVFDRANPPAGLASWAVSLFREFRRGVLAIPGQHDLQYHQDSTRALTAYGCLEAAGVLTDIRSRDVRLAGGVRLVGFGWGDELKPHKPTADGAVPVAVVHHYAWTAGANYPGADESCRVEQLMVQLQGFKAAIVGDNHKPFTLASPYVRTFWNNGSLQRRSRSEYHHRPRCGILHTDGSIDEHLLDCDGELMLPPFDTDAEAVCEVDGRFEFLNALSLVDTVDAASFRDLVMAATAGKPQAVVQQVHRFLGDG